VGGAAVGTNVLANQQVIEAAAIDDDLEDAESDVDLREQLARMDKGEDEYNTLLHLLPIVSP
jgi:hypothetical protein